RGFWMLDDLGPLRQLTPEVAAEPAHLFTPGLTWRMAGGGGRGGGQGTNPPNGAVIDYTIHDQKPGTKVALAFIGADGKVIREFTGTVQVESPKPREAGGTPSATAATPATGAAAAEEEPKEAVRSEGGAAEEEGGEEGGGRRGRDSEKLADVVNGHNR